MCHEDVHLLHDVHHRLTQIQAVRLGKTLELYNLFWMEDSVPAKLQDGLRISNNIQRLLLHGQGLQLIPRRA